MPRAIFSCLGLGWAVATGAVLGLVVGYAAGYREGDNRANEIWKEAMEQVKVVVAQRDLYPGTTIVKGDIAERMIPRVAVDGEETFADDLDVIGQVVDSKILHNEPVREERLDSLESGG